VAFTVGTLDSWTATVGTARTLDAAVTTNGFCQAHIDAKNLAAGEALEVTVEQKVDSGEAAQVAWAATVMGPLACPLIFTPPLTNVGSSLTVKVKQINGTGRAFKGRITTW